MSLLSNEESIDSEANLSNPTSIADGISVNPAERLTPARKALISSHRHWLDPNGMVPQTAKDELGNRVNLDFSSNTLRMIYEGKVSREYAIGWQYARELNAYQGPDIRAVWGAGQGQMVKRDKPDAYLGPEVVNGQAVGKAIGFVNFSPELEMQPDLAQQIGVQSINTLVYADTLEELSYVRSPFIQYDWTGARVEQSDGQIINIVLTTRQLPEGMGGIVGRSTMVKQTDIVEAKLRRGEKPPVKRCTITGKNQQVFLGGNMYRWTGDWTRTDIQLLGVERFEHIDHAMYQIDRYAPTQGHARWVHEGVRTSILAYNNQEMYGYSPSLGEVALVMPLNAIQSVPAFWQSVLGAIAYIKGSQTKPQQRLALDTLHNPAVDSPEYQRKCSLIAEIMKEGLEWLGLPIPRDRMYECDWIEENLPAIRDIVKTKIINSPEFWRTATAGDAMLVVPAITNVSRSGMHTWKSHSIRPEIGMQLMKGDPQYYEQLKRESQQLRSLYGGVINAGFVMSADKENKSSTVGLLEENRGYSLGGRQFVALPALRLDKGHKFINEVNQKAGLIGSASGATLANHREFITALEEMLRQNSTFRASIPSAAAFAIDVEVEKLGKRRLRLLSVDQLKFFSGNQGVLGRDICVREGASADDDGSMSSRAEALVAANVRLWRQLAETPGRLPRGLYEDYFTLIKEAALSSGFGQNAVALHPDGIVLSGPIAAHKDVTMNEIGLDDELIRNVLQIVEQAEVDKVVDLLEQNNGVACIWCEPAMAGSGLYQLRIRSVRCMKLDVTDFGGRPVLNPDSPYSEINFDTDAVKIAIKNHIYLGEDGQWHISQVQRPQTQAEVVAAREKMHRQTCNDRLGDANRKWEEEYSTKEKLMGVLSNKVTEMGTYGFCLPEQAQGYYAKILDNKSDADMMYDIGLRLATVSNNAEVYDVLTTAICQSRLRNQPGSEQMNSMLYILRYIQPVGGGFMLRDGSNRKVRDMDAAMRQILLSLLSMPELPDKEMVALAILGPGERLNEAIGTIRTVRRQLFDDGVKGAQLSIKLGENTSVQNAIFTGLADKPWTNAQKISPLTFALKTLIMAGK